MRSDPWAWTSALAVLPLLLHSLGAPLGEPVAEDFDFLHYAMFSPHPTLLGGGGSTAFWRPVAHQLYYRVLGGLILAHPGWLSALHVALLSLSSLLLYRTFRRAWPGAWSAAIATFPLLSESSRTLISWPSHFVDLGVWLFTAIALHEAAARRLWTALAALLAALLCKEVAVVALVLLPWMPGLGPRGWRERGRWAVATGLLGVLWAVAYVWVRHHADLHLPHHLETAAVTVQTPLLTRLEWAAANSAWALFSMPAAPVPWEVQVWGGFVLLLLFAVVMLAFRSSARARFKRALPLGLWGLAWFVGASATLTAIYPIWAPNRSGYGSLGFAAACAAPLGAAHPLVLGGLVALRLTAFALSPGPPPVVEGAVPEQGAFMDFQRLVRLQRLMRFTRRTLASHYPTLPRGARVGQHYLPLLSAYAFGADKSLQVWYRDSTLRMVSFQQLIKDRRKPLVTIAQFQSERHWQIALVEPAAMRSYLESLDSIKRHAPSEALALLSAADSLQRDPDAEVFRGMVAGARASCLLALGRPEEAEREAQRSGLLWRQSIDRLYVLGLIRAREGRLDEATALLDSVQRFRPEDAEAAGLLARIRAARQTQRGNRP